MKAVIELEISNGANMTEIRQKLEEWVYGMIIIGKPFGILSAHLDLERQEREPHEHEPRASRKDPVVESAPLVETDTEDER